MTQKICIKCRLSKSSDLFVKNKNLCKECRAIYRREWERSNRDKRNEASKEWRKNNPEKAKCCDYRKRYGLTLEQVDLMSKNQGGVCAICSSDAKLHVDHDHVTNKVRGLLCHHCNTMLGLSKENPQILSQAILYLHNHNDPDPQGTPPGSTKEELTPLQGFSSQ